VYDRALWALRSWLDSWSGIGHVAVAWRARGFDLQVTRYDERGWRGLRPRSPYSPIVTFTLNGRVATGSTIVVALASSQTASAGSAPGPLAAPRSCLKL
jgi:hypothetical protein